MHTDPARWSRLAVKESSRYINTIHAANSSVYQYVVDNGKREVIAQ
jgi:hypothetical protein